MQGSERKEGGNKRKGEREKQFLENVIKEHIKMLVETNSARLDYWWFNFLFYTSLYLLDVLWVKCIIFIIKIVIDVIAK